MLAFSGPATASGLASVALEQMCDSGVKMNCVLLTTLMKGFIRSKHLDKVPGLKARCMQQVSSIKMWNLLDGMR